MWARGCVLTNACLKNLEEIRTWLEKRKRKRNRSLNRRREHREVFCLNTESSPCRRSSRFRFQELEGGGVVFGGFLTLPPFSHIPSLPDLLLPRWLPSPPPFRPINRPIPLRNKPPRRPFCRYRSVISLSFFLFAYFLSFGSGHFCLLIYSWKRAL